MINKIGNYVRYFHFDLYLCSFHALRYFSSFRCFHFDIIIHFDLFTSIYKTYLRYQINTSRSFNALRLKSLHRYFHFDSSLHIDVFTSTFLSLRFIHFDQRFHLDIFTSTFSSFFSSLPYRFIHFDIKTYWSKYLALRPKKLCTSTQHLRLKVSLRLIHFGKGKVSK